MNLTHRIYPELLGATLRFIAELRLAIQSEVWDGTGVVKSSFECTNFTRCGGSQMSIVEVNIAVLKLQHEVMAVRCSTDTRKTLYQIMCGDSSSTSGCVIYGPQWLLKEHEERESPNVRATTDQRKKDEIPEDEDNPEKDG